MNSINSILMVPDEPINEVVDDFLAELFQRAHDPEEVGSWNNDLVTRKISPMIVLGVCIG